MGVVYAAYDPTLERKVAIKMLHEGISSSHRRRLEREARAMAKLSHPNVVAVHEVGDFDARLFVAMEFVDGLTLRDWLTQKNPDRKEILRVMREAGRGLAAAHEAGMVHRDFKPDNVLVANDGRVRVSDFGLVTPLGQDAAADTRGQVSSDRTAPPTIEMAALTMVGTVMGTPLYMAPEQHRGEAADHRADQFSFCVTLWEALYKKTPYSATSYEVLVANVTSGLIESPPKANRGAPWLRTILTRGLSVDPKERFASMTELLAALDHDPWKLRRRVAIGVALLGLSGAGALVLAADDGERDQPCAAVDAPLREIWSSDKREAIRAAFVASGAADAETVWPDVDGKLDRYAQDWSSMRTQSCLDAQELAKSPDGNEGLSSRSLHCFERRLAGFRGVLELFSSAPNEKVIHGARQAIADLDAVHYCTDPQYLSNSTPLPSHPAQRDELDRLETEFAEVVILDRRGEYQEALARADLLWPAVDALGYAPMHAKVLVLRGAMQQTLGDIKAAETTLRSAAVAAANARDDVLLAKVWIYLLDLLVAQNRYDEALSIETVATTSAQRVPDELGLQARLHNTLGGIYIAKARYGDALASYDTALAIQRKLGRKGNFALAPAIANVGLAKWYAGDIGAAKLAFEEALEIMLVDYGPDHSHVAYARKNIADLEMQLGNYGQVKEQYDEVARVWKLTLGADHVNLAYAYEQLAMLALRTGDLDEAITYVDMTMDLRLRHLGENNALTVQARSVAIEVYLGVGSEESLAKAEAEIATSMAVQNSLGEAGRRNLVYVLDSRARMSELREDWSAALEDRKAALKIRQETLGVDHVDVAYSHGQIARLSMSLGKPAQAERSAMRAQEIYDANPGYGDQDGISMRRTRAGLRLEQGDNAGARAILLDAIARAEACDCLAGRLSAGFDLARLDASEGQEGARARAQAFRDQAVSARDEAENDIALEAQLDTHIKAMDAWLATP